MGVGYKMTDNKTEEITHKIEKNSIDVNKTKKKGLVLEGGGMRGIYTAGVLDAFLDNDISFDGIIGVSAGAVHGASFASGQKERSIRYYKKYCNDKRFMSFENWIKTGDLVDEQFCFHDIPEKLDPYDYEAFKNSKTRFFVGCSNVETGKAVYLEVKDMLEDIEYFRATASLPYVSRIVEVDGMKLLDGGCTDSIPLRAFAKLGYKKCVVVLTRPLGYRKKPGNFWLPEAAYHKYPEFVKALRSRYYYYNKTVEWIERLEKEEKIFVIRPSVSLPIGRTEHSVDKLQNTYDIGRKDAANNMMMLKRWMKG